MRSFCQLSRRWHQQFCTSPSFAGHQRCLQNLQPVRSYRVSLKDRKPSKPQKPSPLDDLVVREYEQLVSDPTTRVRIDPDAEGKEEAKLIQGHLTELDKELAVLRQGPFGPQSPFILSLPEKDRGRVLKALQQAGVSRKDQDLVNIEEVDDILDNVETDLDKPATKLVQGVTLQLPQRQRAYIKKFNAALEQSVSSPSEIPLNLELWKWYLLCHQSVVGFSSIIPEDVWSMLWTSQTAAYKRPRNVVVLAEHMAAAEVKLTNSQWISYIEAIRDNGDVANAVTTWDEQVPHLGNDEATASAFWDLGVRLHAQLGQPQKAEELALRCLNNSSVVKPDILIPVMLAWAKSQKSDARVKVWTNYLKLRELSAGQMTPEIYEAISTGLLRAKQLDLALAVFKDLMLAQKESPADSMALYRNASKSLKETQPRASPEDLINRTSLTALTIFPKRFLNKFFFGSWIKQLIGCGDLNGASNVVDLMIERHIPLDAKHLNGLIGAWLREGSSSSRALAERMAWAMIHSRIDLVERRTEQRSRKENLSSGHDAPTLHDKTPTKPSTRIPQFLLRAAPAANLETFSILLQYYIRRDKSDFNDANYLTSILTGPAAMIPNSFIMNHWLYGALRSSDVDGVWKRYSSLTRNAWKKRQSPANRSSLEEEDEGNHSQKIQPDLETFAILWDTAKIQYDIAKPVQGKLFPSARLLYAEMNDWLKTLDEQSLATTKEEFSAELYHQIIRCFCLSYDFRGVVCALHALRQEFDVFPDDTITRLIMLQTARILPRESAQRGKLWTLPRSNTRHVKRVADIIKTIGDQHEFRLAEKGVNVATLALDSLEAKQLRLDVLTEFLLSITERMGKPNSNCQTEVETVAKVMGVDLYTVDFSCVERCVKFGRQRGTVFEG